ncbi:MAG: hypothetical protein IJ849_10430 [Selenomonadaceae bacterium]|nr:hypothetical protein [Selenomonadaceae bacterium]
MNYTVYKLHFPQGVHFGETKLESSQMTFQADTLFAALAQEAVAQSAETLKKLVDYVEAGALLFSDAFPYKGKEYFVPKPMVKPKVKTSVEDVAKRKRYKNLAYLPLSKLTDYLEGGEITKTDFGVPYLKTSACIEPGKDTVPYRIGTFYFGVRQEDTINAKPCVAADGEEVGLYVLLGYEDKKVKALTDELMDALSCVGIGGRRSAGLGRFELYNGKFPAKGLERLQGEYQTYMNLSVALPREEEMTGAVEGASFLLIKRSGFVASATYASEPRRKQDTFAFKAGSCFRQKFSGELRDVATGGTHPVYRYLKPVFMGIET